MYSLEPWMITWIQSPRSNSVIKPRIGQVVSFIMMMIPPFGYFRLLGIASRAGGMSPEECT